MDQVATKINIKSSSGVYDLVWEVRDGSSEIEGGQGTILPALGLGGRGVWLHVKSPQRGGDTAGLQSGRRPGEASRAPGWEGGG